MALPIVVTSSDLSAPAEKSGFVLTIEKYLSTNQNAVFSNDYEFVLDTDDLVSSALPLSDAAYSQIAQDFVQFEQAMETTAVIFKEARWSTWTKDRKPFNPLTFKTVPIAIGTVGAKILSGDLCPLDDCLIIKREVPYGLDGRLAFRGYLTESDIDAPGGLIRLANTVGANAELTSGLNSIQAVGAHNYFRSGITSGTPPVTTYAGNPYGLWLAMISQSKTAKGAYQFVKTFTVQGAGIVKQTKRRKKKAAVV